MSPLPFPLLGIKMNEQKGMTIGPNIIDLCSSEQRLTMKVDICVKAEEEDRFFVELCDINMRFTDVIIS